MAAVSVGLHEGGIPAQLQLLLLQCLASALNETQTANSYHSDVTHSKQSITVTVDDPFNNEDIKRLIASLENNITKIIEQSETAIVGELLKTSLKSEQILTDVLVNFTGTSNRTQDMLQESTQENMKQSNRILELQNKLLNLTEEGISTQHAWMEENRKIFNINQELQKILSNITNKNEKLEETIVTMLNNISDLHQQILELTESNHNLLGSVKEKDFTIKELEVKVKEATQKNQLLGDDLNKVTNKYTNIQQSLGLTEQQQNYCRISPASALWKMSHKDPQTQNPAGAFIWTPTHSEIGAGKMQILYSSSRDVYIRGVGKEEMNGWDKGIYEHNSMFRMVENDFKVAYLARKVGTTEGMISWKFDLSASGTSVDNIIIRFSTSLFHDGKVDAQACASSECINIPIGNQVFETSHFQGVSQIVIKAKTTLGLSSAAWQHAQLFRQLLSDTTGYGFDLTINLKRCDVSVL